MNRPRINTIANPACIDAKNNVWAPEIYRVKGTEIVFYHRKDAIKETGAKAVEKGKVFIITLNTCDFCRINANGTVEYIYRPDEDKKTGEGIKNFHINRGYVHPHYKGLMAA